MLLEKTVQNIEGSLIREQLPREMRMGAETFTSFIEDYYRFLNAEQGPSYTINRIIAEHDLDKVFDDTYINAIRKEVAAGIPTSPWLQKTFLLRRLVDSYTSRGSEQSIAYLFRMFFNDDIEIFKPWEHVLMPSQGKWETEIRARIILAYGTETRLSNSTLIQYDQFGNIAATAAIKSAKRKVFGPQYYFDVVFYKDANYQAFRDDLPVQTEDGTAYGYLTRSLAKIIVDDGGAGYSLGDRVYLGGKEDVSFNARVSAIDPNTGAIASLDLTNPGVSASINYVGEIVNDPIKLSGVTEMYLNGVIAVDGLNRYYIDTAPENYDDADDAYQYPLTNNPNYLATLLGLNVDVYATRSDDGLTIVRVQQKFDHTVLHDFEYYNMYDASDLPDFDYSKLPRSLANVVIQSSKSDPGVGLPTFAFAFNTIYETNGSYTDELHRPSGISVLQDSFYYQIFSYEITSNYPMNAWEDLIDDFIHPAGFKFFASTIFSETAKLGSDLVGAIDNSDYVYEMLQLILSKPLPLKSEVGLIELGEDGPLYGTDPYASNKFEWALVFTDPEDDIEYALSFTLAGPTAAAEQELVMSSNTIDSLGVEELVLDPTPQAVLASGFLSQPDTLPSDVFTYKWERSESGTWTIIYGEAV